MLGWRQRWIADDGLIEARVVRQILAGHGPVFNPGERVEADTSALWTWLLAVVTWASRLDLYTVIIGSGLLLAPLGLLLALQLGARRLHREQALVRIRCCCRSAQRSSVVALRRRSGTSSPPGSKDSLIASAGSACAGGCWPGCGQPPAAGPAGSRSSPGSAGSCVRIWE